MNFMFKVWYMGMVWYILSVGTHMVPYSVQEVYLLGKKTYLGAVGSAKIDSPKRTSATGTRTPVSCVKGKYDNHLHHGGWDTSNDRCPRRQTSSRRRLMTIHKIIPPRGLEPRYPAWEASMITTYIMADGSLHQPRIELGAKRWQRFILPLNHWCVSHESTNLQQHTWYLLLETKTIQPV